MSSIFRLPESTTRPLGSSLVITTPVALIKELLDNSIDAKASSIEVIISTDTVKKIEVRDNGVGIHPDDYDALGRRGHTSKLKSFDELRTQSAKTLGFRGEALASANSLAQVTITTKIALEPVAAVLHIVPGKGGVSKQKPTSAPVGTTVSITNLFEKHPVRQKMVIKESAKMIDKIRDVLHSYAMARPQLRLLFKVLQSPKQTWSYSPKPGASVSEAVVQLLGADIMAHYFEKIFEVNELRYKNSPSNSYQTPQNSPTTENYVFEAFMLKPNCGHSKALKLRFFSVDGRPITGKRGTMKKLLNIYNEFISTTFQQNSSAIVPKDYSIRLNIRCPPGSYDANIEPSKDDVLFSNENIVLDRFKDLCKEVYGIPTAINPVGNSSTVDDGDETGTQGPSPVDLQGQSDSRRVDRANSPLQTRSHATLEPTLPAHSQQDSILDRQPLPNHSQERLQQVSSPTNIEFTPINKRTVTTRDDPISTSMPSFTDMSPDTRYVRRKVDMSTDLNEYSHGHSRKKQPQHTQAPINRVDVLECSALQNVNPWVVAKMNAPMRINGRIMGGSIHENSSSQPFEPAMTPDPPVLRHMREAPRDLDVPPSQQYLHSLDSPSQLQPTYRVPGGPYRSPMSSPHGTNSQKVTNSKLPAPPESRRRRGHAPWSPPSSAERIIPSDDLMINREERGPDGMKQTKISFNGVGGKSKKRRIENEDSAMDNIEFQHQEHDGENSLQKMVAAARRCLNHQLSQEKDNRNSNHNSQQAYICPKVGAQQQQFAQLNIDPVHGESSSKIKEPIKTSLSNDDSRAYLLRRQKSMAAQGKNTIPKKHRRMKSSLLPLENVPPNDQMHFTILVETLNIETLRTSMKGGLAYDRYMEKGAIKNGLEMDLSTGRKVEERLKSLLRGHAGMDDGGEAELEIGLCSILKGKGALVIA